MHTFHGLQQMRVHAGWSVTELARRSNTSDLTITVLENGGTCDTDSYRRICDALPGMTTTTILPETPVPPRRSRAREER